MSDLFAAAASAASASRAGSCVGRAAIEASTRQALMPPCVSSAASAAWGSARSAGSQIARSTANGMLCVDGDARHRAAFQIDRRGAGLLALPAFLLDTRHDRIGAEQQMRRRAAEHAREVRIGRVAFAACDHRRWHDERAGPERRIQSACQSEADQAGAALPDEVVGRCFRAGRRPTANCDRPTKTSRDASLGRQPDDDTNAHVWSAHV